MERPEYNLLTQKLLAEGYSVENYPDYVQIDTSRWGKDPLEKVSGGFEYKRWYSDRLVYKTGCGKYVMGSEVMPHMSYMDVDWTHENNCPTILCPYHKSGCEQNDPRLFETSGFSFCACHQTEEAYQYDNSIEKVLKEKEQEKERKYQEYAFVHNGRACRNHMYYDEKNGTWSLNYAPLQCVNRCNSAYCPILGREKNKKRGNVYYDLKTSFIRQDGTLFDGEEVVSITKGKQFFKAPVSMDICEAFIKLQSGEIYRKYLWEQGTLFMMMNKTWKFEILNIRAESKPSRDLLKDLEDIKAGIDIVHESDLIKRQKEFEQARKSKRQEKEIKKLENKILQTGYDNLSPYGADRRHADKWLTKERIAELEKLRLQKEMEERNKPVQLSLFE
ncbi:MAG: sarcolemmal membrane-associated protein [Lachnospiraceae bacterium]|nr:sarcolemmal membrane-associated protein [Lachnospiraceae bacterium]